MLSPGSAMADVFDPPERVANPTPSLFSVCFNHGCASVADVRLTPAQWQSIRALFPPGPATPAEERRRITEAIGRLETIVGPLSGTENDKGGSLSAIWTRNQMDCVDEATNTQTYLHMLKNDGLIKHHNILDHAARFLPYFFPHVTAVIEELATHEEYAVDSWFEDNGRPPYIIPLKAWRWGWTPGDDLPDNRKDNVSEESGAA